MNKIYTILFILWGVAVTNCARKEMTSFSNHYNNHRPTNKEIPGQKKEHLDEASKAFGIVKSEDGRNIQPTDSIVTTTDEASMGVSEDQEIEFSKEEKRAVKKEMKKIEKQEKINKSN